mgnify:FL=1
MMGADELPSSSRSSKSLTNLTKSIQVLSLDSRTAPSSLTNLLHSPAILTLSGRFEFSVRPYSGSSYNHLQRWFIVSALPLSVVYLVDSVTLSIHRGFFEGLISGVFVPPYLFHPVVGATFVSLSCPDISVAFAGPSVRESSSLSIGYSRIVMPPLRRRTWFLLLVVRVFVSVRQSDLLGGFIDWTQPSSYLRLSYANLLRFLSVLLIQKCL